MAGSAEAGAPRGAQGTEAPGSVRARVVAGAVFGPLVVVAALLGGEPFAILVALVAGLAARELSRMAERLGHPNRRGAFVASGAAVPLVLHFAGPTDPAGVLAALGMVAFGALTSSRSIASLAPLFGLLLYGPFLLGQLVALRDVGAGPLAGRPAVLAVLAITWSTDTAAYVIGRRFGRRRLAPRISPKKTVEGALAGLVAAVLAAVFAGWAFAHGLDGRSGVFAGLVLGVGCQIGDLLESALKRRAGVKDASSLIPGHGGVMDRFDSLLIAAPLARIAFSLG